MNKHPFSKSVLIVIGILLELFASYFVLTGRLVSASSEITTTEISQNTNWTKVGSPYFVRNKIYITPGSILSFEPGTIVKFSHGAGITVGGALNVVGTPEQKIYLTSLNDNSVGGHGGGSTGSPSSGDWSGVSFISSSSSISIRNVSLRYSDLGLFLNQRGGDLQNIEIASSSVGISLYNGSLSINGGYFHDLNGPAFSAYGSSTLSVVYSSIANVLGTVFSIFNNSHLSLLNSSINGIQNNPVLNLYNQGQVDIGSSTIQNINAGSSGSGLVVFNDSKLSIVNSLIRNTIGAASVAAYNDQSPDSGLFISNSVIDGGEGDGILIYGNTKADISNSTVKNFQRNGIEEFSGGRANIKTSIISNNHVGLTFNDPFLTISTSSIKANVDSGVAYNGAPILIMQGIWWGDAGGPYNQASNASGTANKVSDGVIFDPWLTSDPFANVEATTTPANTTGSNVIFLPGLEASRLYAPGLLFENQLWEPNINADTEKLFLDSQGKSLDQNIYTRDIINRTNLRIFDRNIYKSFSTSMDHLVVNGTINSWEPIPYDWRMDLNDIISNGIKLQDRRVYLIPEIERMASSSKTGKVTLITHSNGGLLAESIIEALKVQGRAGLIDKLIMIAPPEVGTPKSIGGLLHGDEQNLPLVLSKTNARMLGENMISAYNLLPSQKYFNVVQTPVIEFDPSVDKVANFRSYYGNSIKSYQSLSDFLMAKKDNRAKPISTDTNNPNILNANLLNNAKTVHNVMDNAVAPSGLQVIKVAGWGIPTTRGIEYLGKEECLFGVLACSYFLDHELLKTLDGDGTVVTPSVTSDNGTKLYLNVRSYNSANNKNLKHDDILESTAVNSLIENVIKGASSSLPVDISSTKPVDPNSQNLEISVHSPVSVDAYDSLGNHTGLFASSSSTLNDMLFVEQNIPNSSYEETGEGKYIDLGNGSYNIKIMGLDLGSFTLRETIKQGDAKITENVFADIPTTPDMVATLSVAASSSSIARPVLSIDADGDGTIDATTTSATEIDPAYYIAIMKKVLVGLDINSSLKTGLLKKIDNLLRLISQGKIKNASKKISAFSHNLEQKITKPKIHGRRITPENAEILADLLNKLLDALSSN